VFLRFLLIYIPTVLLLTLSFAQQTLCCCFVQEGNLFVVLLTELESVCRRSWANYSGASITRP